MLTTWFIGLVFGFLGSIPIAGPIAAIVLQRGMTGRALSGALVGLGCAVAEAIYAFLAFWGFSTYLTAYPWVEPASHLVAALILIALGIHFTRYQSRSTEQEALPEETRLKSLALGFSVTLLNPTLIATWTGATTTLYSSGLVSLSPSTAPLFACGAFLGISSWFGLLSYLLHRLRHKFRTETLDRAVQIIGYLLLALGLYFAWRFISPFTT